MGIYVEWNAQAHTKSYQDIRPDAAETAHAKGKAAQLLFLLVFKRAWATTADWMSSLVFVAHIASCIPATQLTTEIEGTAGMQKLTGSSTIFHCGNGCDRSCKSLLRSSPEAPE